MDFIFRLKIFFFQNFVLFLAILGHFWSFLVIFGYFWSFFVIFCHYCFLKLGCSGKLVEFKGSHLGYLECSEGRFEVRDRLVDLD